MHLYCLNCDVNVTIMRIKFEKNNLISVSYSISFKLTFSIP